MVLRGEDRRLAIVEFLHTGAHNLQEIADEMNISVPTARADIKMCEALKLVKNAGGWPFTYVSLSDEERAKELNQNSPPTLAGATLETELDPLVSRTYDHLTEKTYKGGSAFIKATREARSKGVTVAKIMDSISALYQALSLIDDE